MNSLVLGYIIKYNDMGVSENKGYLLLGSLLIRILLFGVLY